MSLTSKQIDELRSYAKDRKGYADGYADAKAESKGKWLMDGERCGELMWRCSECNVSEAVPTATSFISGVAYPQWKFCPNCGSPMDGGEQE